MENLLKFNEQFPNSTYREIFPQVKNGTLKEYQESKAPMSNKEPCDFDSIKNTPNRIGWVVPNEYIVVDVDSKRDASIVYEILVAKKVKFSFMTGKHGGHFIFKNPNRVDQKVKKPTPIGINIDTRSLKKGYIILPYHDSDRTWGNITNDVDDLPYFLTPLKNVKIDVDFVTMGENDGRNQELFKHFLNLKDYADELTLEEKVECIKIINDFVLKEKLDDKELLKTVLREEIINKEPNPSVRMHKISLEEISSKIISDKQMICCNDDLYLYNGKYYEKLEEKEVERMIHEEYFKKLEERHRKEIIKFIKLKTYVRADDVNKNWNEIVCKNGILNISTMTLYPHTATKYNTIYIDYDYNEAVPYSNVIDNFLNTISNNDPDKKQLLLEIVGYCFVQRNVFQKFFICYGEGQTGKSTYLTMINRLVGDKNCSFLDMDDLDKDFMGAGLFGKLVNIGDDINFSRIKKTGSLKKLVSGEKLTVREIYKSPFSFNNFAKLIFSTNIMPAVSDKTYGFYRRLIILDINNKISNPDRFFLDKLGEKDYEYLFYKSIEAVRGALKRNSFTTCLSSENNLEAFRTEQSSVLKYMKDKHYVREDLILRAVAEVYIDYKAYCSEFGYSAVNRSNFVKEICAEYNLRHVCTTKNGENQQWRFKD